MSIENADEDDIEKIRTRYYSICASIIKFISAKFGIEIDSNWIETQYGKLPALTVSMYQFFVLDIFYVILEVLNNYISRNIDDLFNVFSDAIQGKDVSTLTNMKIMDPKYAAIVSCMYDVTDYAFTMIDNETIFDYINKDYLPAAILKAMMNNGAFTGDFVHVFADIYRDNLALRSKISFELIYKIKEQGYLPYNPITLRADQIVAANDNEEIESSIPSSNSIEDDVDSE